MPNLNKVMLMGNITRDIEMRGGTVASFSIAVSRKWKDQQGQMQEETSFIDCTAFGKTGEVINEHFGKGKPIFIEGRLKLDQWQDRDGGKRQKLGVIVESFQFIDGGQSRGGGGGGGGGGGYSQSNRSDGYGSQHDPEPSNSGYRR